MEEKKAPDIKKAAETKKAPDIKKNSSTLNAGSKQIKTQKKKKKISAGALISIVLVIIIIGVCAAVYFDLGGAKGILASLLKLDTVTSAQGDTTGISADQTKLDQREDTLNKKQEELNKKEDELKTKEDELKTKEQELTDRENAVKDAEKTVDEQQKEYLTSVSQIYEKMDVKKAAKAISGLASAQEMAQVLMYMTKDQAGKVLDQINSTVATEILSEMMK